MSISRTVCWKDGDDKVVPVAAHKFLSISRDQMITYRIPYANAWDFCCKLMKCMKIASSKSSLQRGSLSRKTKLCAEHVVLGHNKRYHNVRLDGIQPLHDLQHSNIRDNSMMFGSPSIRAVSKIAASIMQITLKVKSSNSVDQASPTLSLLCGGDEWTCITQSCNAIKARCDTRYGEPIIATSNLHHISLIADSIYTKLIATNAVCMMMGESRKAFDPAEVDALIHLVMVMSTHLSGYEHGLCSDILDRSMHPWMRPLCYMNSCHYNTSRDMNMDLPVHPTALIEFLFLSNTSKIKGICDYHVP